MKRLLLLVGLVSTVGLQAQKAVSSEVTLTRMISLPRAHARPVRLDKLPNGNLVYGTLNGQIFEIVDNIPVLFASVEDHNLSYLSSMDVEGDYIYICGSIIQPGDTMMIGYIWKGYIPDKTWTLLADSDPYYLGLGFNDHRFSSLIVDQTGEYVYVHSGTRTNAGEVHHLTDVHGTIDLRDQAIRGKLFKLPTNLDQPIHLSVDSTKLYASGYIFADGLRHCFALGWGPDNSLYGASNSDRRDVGEAFYQIMKGRNYGFPWWIGGEINPLQFADYNVGADKLAGSSINNQGYYNPDPLFPVMPADIDFVQPFKNIGPDGDKYRDPVTGNVLDASDEKTTTTTFSGHRSPTGLKFDLEDALPEPFTGDGFMVSYGGGLGGDRKDLLHLTLKNNDTLSAVSLAEEFNSLLDVFIDGNELFLLESGNSNGSGKAIYKISFAGTTSIAENDIENNIVRLVPNPASSEVYLEIKIDEEIEQINIVDINGINQQQRTNPDTGSFDISSLPSGIYLVAVTFKEDRTVIKRLIKH